jgi:hypothetical protein
MLSYAVKSSKTVNKSTVATISPSFSSLSPLSSISSSLLIIAKKVNSCVFKQIQPLLPKHPGWGVSSRMQNPLEPHGYREVPYNA